MRLRLFLPLLIVFALANAFAQVESASPAASFEAFRPVGESRVWTFEVDRQTIGSLTSTVTGKTEIDGIDGFVIQQDLRLDFAKAGSEIAILAEGEQYISRARILSRLRPEADDQWTDVRAEDRARW